MLLTFCKLVRYDVKPFCISHSLSMRDWIDKFAYIDILTHLLLVVICTMGSFTKSIRK